MFLWSKMSNTAEIDADVTEENKHVCANCGIAGVDNNESEECTACQICSLQRQMSLLDHREQHEEECKNQAAELHDKTLFTQPSETHLGERPLCFLPMPLDPPKSIFWSCCSETICKGCLYAHVVSSKYDMAKARSCPFCREPADDDENNKRMMVRIKANDPAALSQMGWGCYKEGDYDAAFEYATKAAELGDSEAHYLLGVIYHKGEGVEKNDEKKVYHFEKAAIGGHPEARHNLALFEGRNGKTERSVKHFIIGAKLGYEISMKELWNHYSHGHISKEDLDATLRSHHAAVDAMKSAHRDAAERVDSLHTPSFPSLELAT